MSSRRKFIQTSALGLAGTVSLPFASLSQGTQSVTPLQLGIAGYTFAKLDVATAISIMKRVGIYAISIKDIHLPLNSNQEKIESVLAQFNAAGIKVYTVGVIYMKTKQAVDEAFDYAKRVGVPMIVGVPNPELLDYTEEKVKATNIKLAIHNHGPEDALYPGPQNAYDLIKNRDARIGLCLDIGHAMRAGTEPAKAVLDFKTRIFDLHIKDVSKVSRESSVIEMGRGIIDFPALVKALISIKYQGYCSIEFEKDMTDPLPGIAESAGFFRGVTRCVAN